MILKLAGDAAVADEVKSISRLIDDFTFFLF